MFWDIQKKKSVVTNQQTKGSFVLWVWGLIDLLFPGDLFQLDATKAKHWNQESNLFRDFIDNFHCKYTHE